MDFLDEEEGAGLNNMSTGLSALDLDEPAVLLFVGFLGDVEEGLWDGSLDRVRGFELVGGEGVELGRGAEFGESEDLEAVLGDLERVGEERVPSKRGRFDERVTLAGLIVEEGSLL